jgi:hypothetical protein
MDKVKKTQQFCTYFQFENKFYQQKEGMVIAIYLWNTSRK